MFKIGQEVRLRFGGSGATQAARIEEMKADKIGVRRFRVRSGWSKQLEWWDGETLVREVSEVAALLASPDRSAFLAAFDPANQED